jgi:hypothetical protein
VESPKEADLYIALSKYVNEQYNKAITKQDKRRNVAFALVILQRRLASSTYALLRSLERRKKRLDELLEGATQNNNRSSFTGIDPDEAEDMDEQERWAQEEVWETLSVAENQDELRAEIETLKDLLRRAKAIVDSERLKLRHLKTPGEVDREYLVEDFDLLESAFLTILKAHQRQMGTSVFL